MKKRVFKSFNFFYFKFIFLIYYVIERYHPQERKLLKK
jgi:hypothetical protein